MKRKRAFGAAVLMAGALLAGGPPADAALSGRDPGQPVGEAGKGVSEVAVATVMRVNHVSRAEAIRRLDAQQEQAETAGRLMARLGVGRTAGAWVDDRTGDLVVGVVDAGAAAVVRAAGARPQRVRYSTAELEAVRARVRPGAGTVESTLIDGPTNKVVVRIARAALDGPTARATRALSPAVAIEPGVGTAIPTAQNVWPGFDHLTTGTKGCTAGYTARTPLGLNFMVTAAHCVLPQLPPVPSGLNGVLFGHTASAVANRDVAAVLSDFPASYTLGPQLWTYGHGAQTVSGVVATAIKGHFVCKSGRITGETCGTVLAVGVTGFGRNIGGQIVNVIGLSEVNACGKRGDSGGPVYYPSALTPQRVGIAGTSSSSIVYDRPMHEITDPNYTGPEYCGNETMPNGQPINAPTRMWFQPAAETLSALSLIAVTG